MRFYVFLLLWNEQFPIIIKQPVQTLQNLGLGQVQLIKYQPMPLPDRRHQGTFSENQLALLIGEVVAQVLLDLCVLMVVDSDAFVTCKLCDVLYHACFTCRGRALKQDREVSACDCSEKVFEMFRKRLGQMENLNLLILHRSLFHQEPMNHLVPLLFLW